jgi:hypothetical protein
MMSNKQIASEIVGINADEDAELRKAALSRGQP